ncbi:LAME_0E11276g1_1 [Lachancea meyersii CBS 8951]|uniref:LAME_0E11276g1_1 n=1 Tax=Lachancea meyersii CBS 8951 TaxID=1266667 RepID=A0A1G4JKU3_9SACH|nr:LAME_0E11276g1_1 [Lachancea meyersii CBS 8951]
MRISRKPETVVDFPLEDVGTTYETKHLDVSDPHQASHLVRKSIPKSDEDIETTEQKFRLKDQSWDIILSCFGISFTGFFFGYDTGTVGGITNMQAWLKRFGHYDDGLGQYEMATALVGIVVSSFHVGCIIGGFTIARLADTLGRRIPIAISCFTYMVGISIQLSAGHGKWYQYMLGRMVTGLTVGANAVLTPMLLSEIAPPRIRGVIVNFYQLNTTHGILAGYIADYATKSIYKDDRMWRLPLLGGYVFSAILLPVLVYAPESPRFLIKRGRYTEAKKCLARLRGLNIKKLEDSVILSQQAACLEDVDKELAFLNETIRFQEQRQRNTTFWQLFSKRFIKRTLSGMCIMGFQQMSGIDYFLYYGTRLFKSVGIDDSYKTSIILGAINAAMTYVSLFVADNLGRKKGLFWGSVSCFICLFIFSTVGVVMIDRADAPDYKLSGYIMITFTCLFIVMFCCSWSAIASVLVSEIFTLEIKAQAMAFSQAFNWGSNFFIAFCTPIITARIGYAFGYVFAACMFVAIIFVYFMIPETKGLTLEEIDDIYEKDN